MPPTESQAQPEANAPKLPTALGLLQPSWRAIQLNFITLIEFIILPVMVSLLSALVFQKHASLSTGLSTGSSSHIVLTKGYFIAQAVSTLASLLLAPGMTYVLLVGARGKRVDFLPAFLHGIKYFWRYLGLLICSGIVIAIGFVLLIVPGIFMLRRYYLAPFYLIDRDLGVFEAMRVSAKESKSFTMAILGVLGAQILFALLLIIPIIGWIGGIILSVMYYNAPAIRYKQIASATGYKPKK